MSFSKIIALFILAGILFIICKIQFLLSKKENKLYGLILPFLIFGLSLFLSFGATPTTLSTDTNMQTISENGTITNTHSSEEQSLISVEKSVSASSIVYVLLTVNTGTLLLAVIYIICRRKMTTKIELKKMKLEEL